MYYVYFLKSLKNDDVYVGCTANIQKRLKRHNSGKVKSTQYYRPWKLLGFERFNTLSGARRQEKFLKTGQQRELLKKRFRDR